MRVFICHAAQDADVARAVELALREEGHAVFLDRSSLPAGESYHDQIRAAIDRSDLFLFLLSPDAVAKGRYTLTELELAEQRWPEPSGHVLPVVVKPTDLAVVPQYARAVTILEPQGNVPATVVMAVARLSKGWPWRRTAPWLVAAGLLILVGGSAVGWWARRHAARQEVQGLLRQGALLRDAGHYADAWKAVSQASGLSPGEADVVLARESVAMAWLENARVTVGQGTFVGLADTVQPVIAECAASSDARRAADCLAHLGWADFLRAREGVGGLDPTEQYRRAIALDPDNVYAHALWGFHVLASGGGGLAEARPHFAKALAGGRARDYVRRMQLASLFYRHDPDLETEALRVANDMRVRGQAIPSGPSDSGLTGRLWNVYSDRLLDNEQTRPFLAVLSPADHLATFRWLFPETPTDSSKRNLYLYMLARLQEEAGQHAEALTNLRTLQLGPPGEGGPLVDGTRAAIRRLSAGK